MVTMICEMCGCRDVVKRNGLYVCSECGTKYSPEDARKLLWKIDDEEDGEFTRDEPRRASSTRPACEEWSAASRSVEVTATEEASDNPLKGAASSAGLFIVLISNAILSTAILCQVPQKVPSVFHGNIADLVFILAGVAAAATLVLSAVAIMGGVGKRNAYLSAATCSALCCVLAIMSIGDGPLYPIVYLLFALIDASVAWVLRKE